MFILDFSVSLYSTIKQKHLPMRTPLIIIIVLIFFVSSSVAQITSSSLSTYYGNNSKLGFELTMTGKTVWGIGASFHLGKGGVGEDYSATMGPNAFPKDIYQVISADYVGIYGIVGKQVTKNLTVTGVLGFSERLKYYNGYDKYQILSPSGYWYTGTSLGVDVLYGATIQYNIDHVTPYIGYDNFNGVKVGIGYTFQY